MGQMNKGLANQNIVILRRMLNVVAVTIPKHILEEVDWREGDLVRITKDGKRLIVERGQISFETNVDDSTRDKQ